MPIEARDAEEVLSVTGHDARGEVVAVQLAPPGTRAVNYAFDVTPARLVAGLVTERGLVPATRAGIEAMFPERAQ
jgi:methylthioribose-1-phosphate isomerase